MQRVMIIGGPGSGKSWLAAKLSNRLQLPVIAIDALLHDPSGHLRPADAIDADARAATLGDRWIIEGGNTRTYAERLARADCLIRLRPHRVVRLWGVVRRGGATVPLLRWTWNYDRVFGPAEDRLLASAPAIPVHDLRSRRAVRTWFESLGQ